MIIKNRTIVTNKTWWNLYLFGDWHLGHMSVNKVHINAAASYLGTKTEKDGGVILLGDLIENVVQNSKGTHYELDIPSPEKQIETSVSIIEKFKHILLASVEGNHEMRTQHRTSILPGKQIMKEVFYRDYDKYYFQIVGLLNLTFKDTKGKTNEKYKIFITHGNGNSSSTAGKLNKIHALRDRADADIYVQGHIHQKLGMSDYIVKDNILHKRIFATCSSYLVDASYGEEFGFKPTDYGLNTINLNTKKHDMIGYY
jgi:predicted phosphodiesterase